MTPQKRSRDGQAYPMVVQVRLSTELHAALALHAAELDVTMSQAVRDLVAAQLLPHRDPDPLDAP